MTRLELIEQIKIKQTNLCVGLDPDLTKIPVMLLKEEDPIFSFCQNIVDATADYCIAFKPNTAFFEAYGVTGLMSLVKTMTYIKKKHPNHFLIADAKRGDIGNTSSKYAEAFFNYFNSDAITVTPYMGEDSVKPFLNYQNKWTIILALTSNEGAQDFQLLQANQKPIYKNVIETSKLWGDENNTMYVVGATKADLITDIRTIIPNHFLLIPGVGAQGGSIQEVFRYGQNTDCGLIINASRSILYASKESDYANKAAIEAKNLKTEISKWINIK